MKLRAHGGDQFHNQRYENDEVWEQPRLGVALCHFAALGHHQPQLRHEIGRPGHQATTIWRRRGLNGECTAALQSSGSLSGRRRHGAASLRKGFPNRNLWGKCAYRNDRFMSSTHSVYINVWTQYMLTENRGSLQAASIARFSERGSHCKAAGGT